MSSTLIDKLIKNIQTQQGKYSSETNQRILLPTFLSKFTDFSLKYANPNLLSEGFVSAAKRLEKQLVDNVATPAWFAIDFSTNQYAFVHQSVLYFSGHNSKYYLKGGPDAFLERWDESVFKLLNEKIFGINMDYLARYSSELIPLLFSQSFRMKKRDGNMMTGIQKYSFILSPQLNPIGIVGYVIDISPYADNSKIVQLIEQIDNSIEDPNPKLILKNYYYLNEEDTELTKREIEILKLLSDGILSKQVADKLNISIHTVNNHRKNMLQKTNSKSSAELINYAIKHHYL